MKKLIVFLLMLLLAVTTIIKGIPGYIDPLIDVSDISLESFTPVLKDIVSFETQSVPTSVVYTDETEAEATSVITQGLADFEGEIDLALYGIPVSEMETLYTEILDAYPQWFYTSRSCTYTTLNDVVISLRPEYNMTQQEYLQKKVRFDVEVEKALAAIPNGISDVEKVLAVSDYIALSTTYDESKNKSTAYNLFVEKKAVCEGYSLAFGILMDRLGIENQVVNSESMEHAWNMVKIYGNWYHVDVTWNDPTPDQLGRAGHKFLLLSDAVIGDSEHRHYDWDTEKYPSADDDTYKDALWTQTDTAIVIYDSKWYYTYSSDGLKHNIIAFDPVSGDASVIYKFDSQWKGEENYHWAINSCVGRYKDKLFYNTADAVYMINFDGTENTEVVNEILSGTDSIYEMCVQGNELRYRIRSAPAGGNSEYTEKMVVLD